MSDIPPKKTPVEQLNDLALDTLNADLRLIAEADINLLPRCIQVQAARGTNRICNAFSKIFG